jgi:hypothetical protein
MGNQILTLAATTSGCAEHFAALLPGGPAPSSGPALSSGLALAARPCPAPVVVLPARVDVRPRAVAPIRGQVCGAALSSDGRPTAVRVIGAAAGSALDRAWMPSGAGVDQTLSTTVFTKYTYVFVKHDPGETALRPPV